MALQQNSYSVLCFKVAPFSIVLVLKCVTIILRDVYSVVSRIEQNIGKTYPEKEAITELAPGRSVEIYFAKHVVHRFLN